MATPLLWKTTDDISIWTQNWPWIPRLTEGPSDYVPTTSKLVGGGLGVLVRTLNGKPIAVYGNPDHPLSLGGIDALTIEEAKLMYSLSRVSGPMKKDGGAFAPISWDEAESLLAEKISRAGNNVAFISGDENGTANEVVAGLLARLGSDDYFMMPGEAQPAFKVLSDWLGMDGQLGYDLENADYILAIGADLMESWGNPVRNQRVCAENHAKLVTVGPFQNRTAAGADGWVPINAGAEATFAFALAAELLARGKQPSGATNADQLKSFIQANYPASRAEKEAGVNAYTLAVLAEDLAHAANPVVVMGSSLGQGLGAYNLMAGLAINLILDRFNKPGGVYAVPVPEPVVDGAPSRAQMFKKDLAAYMDDIGGGGKAPDVLMVYEANPVYALPEAGKLAGAFAKAGFKVSFSPFMDETAAACDLIMPAPLSIERFDDVCAPFGLSRFVYSVSVPVAEPVADAKNTMDVILSVARKTGNDLGFKNAEAVIEARVDQLSGLGIKAKFRTLAKGKVVDLDYAEAYQAMTGSAAPSVQAIEVFMGDIGNAQPAGGDAEYPFALVPTVMVNAGTGKVAVPPNNLYSITAQELAGNDYFVEVNGATAAKTGLHEGDKVKITAPGGECTARVHIFEGVADDTVVAPIGFGRTAWDKYSNGKGDNTYKVISYTGEPGTGLTVWTGSRVKIAKI